MAFRKGVSKVMVFELQDGTVIEDDCYGCGMHSIQKINDSMYKCHICKRYFKEVDLNGNLKN